jgi:hypothetical protein
LQPPYRQGVALIEDAVGSFQIEAHQFGVLGTQFRQPLAGSLSPPGQVGEPVEAFQHNALGPGGEKRGRGFRGGHASPNHQAGGGLLLAQPVPDRGIQAENRFTTDQSCRFAALENQMGEIRIVLQYLLDESHFAENGKNL